MFIMCGIVGASFSCVDEIQEMADSLSHRGPDDSDVFSDGNISLGHRRLSILDLSDAGCQPMSYEDVVIVFNGEIYNYRFLKDQLKDKGYTFSSETDTEIVAAAYCEWGQECVERFNGMWSLAVYDKEDTELFCSRDRLGIKPFYFYNSEGCFVFGSEIKSIMLSEAFETEIDRCAVSDYLMFRSPLDNRTMYEGVEELAPGENIVYDLEKEEMDCFRYWDIEPGKYQERSEEDVVQDVGEILMDSVEKRMISDVPVGSMLSGGLDSSLIASLMKKENPKLDTFTVRFENSFDEGDFARKVSEFIDSDHNELFLDFEDYMEAMEEYAALKDQPIGVPNEVALYRLSEKIRGNDNKVVLAGEGADELFYGYSRLFRSPFDYEAINACSGKLEEELPMIYEEYGKEFDSMLDLFLHRYTYWPEEELRKQIDDSYFNEDYRGVFSNYWSLNHDYEHKISYLMLKIHVPVLLSRFDRSMMGHGIEGRVPFLDHRVVENVFSLPNEQKIKWKSSEDYLSSIDKPASETAGIHDIPKFALKEFGRGKIPDEIIERTKQGFPIPFLEWKEEMIEYSRELLNEDSFVRGLFSEDYLENLREQVIKTDDNYNAQRLWMLISLELWHQNWVEDEKCR